MSHGAQMVSIAIALVVDHPLATIAGFTLLTIGVYSAVITFWAIPGQALTGVGAAAGIGLINSVGNLSGFAGPYLIGLIKTAPGSYTPGFLLVAALGRCRRRGRAAIAASTRIGDYADSDYRTTR